MKIEHRAWKDRADYEAWWLQNVVAINWCAAYDKHEYERITRAIVKFNEEHPR